MVCDVRTLLRPGSELSVEVGPPGPVDLRLVGEVARLHLAAGRCGAHLSVRDTGGRLAELVRLVGLDLPGLHLPGLDLLGLDLR
ncbi:MAG: hypothetical protein JWO60_1853, partial [Frankiales bacterium]|nr:hypothetical protein [Frankiales bacterium]